MQAQYPVKVQAIRSKGRTDRFYVFIPLPLAAAIELVQGEEFQWTLTDRDTLQVKRITQTQAKSESKNKRRDEKKKKS